MKGFLVLITPPSLSLSACSTIFVWLVHAPARAVAAKPGAANASPTSCSQLREVRFPCFHAWRQTMDVKLAWSSDASGLSTCKSRSVYS